MLEGGSLGPRIAKKHFRGRTARHWDSMFDVHVTPGQGPDRGRPSGPVPANPSARAELPCMAHRSPLATHGTAASECATPLRAPCTLLRPRRGSIASGAVMQEDRTSADVAAPVTRLSVSLDIMHTAAAQIGATLLHAWLRSHGDHGQEPAPLSPLHGCHAVQRMHASCGSALQPRDLSPPPGLQQ